MRLLPAADAPEEVPGAAVADTPLPVTVTRTGPGRVVLGATDTCRPPKWPTCEPAVETVAVACAPLPAVLFVVGTGSMRCWTSGCRKVSIGAMDSCLFASTATIARHRCDRPRLPVAATRTAA